MKILFKNMFKLLTRYNLLLIIVILLYYIIIFSDLLSKGGSLAIIFSIAGWSRKLNNDKLLDILEKGTVYTYCN